MFRNNFRKTLWVFSLIGQHRPLSCPSSLPVKKNLFKISISSTFETMSSSESDEWLARVFVRQKWMEWHVNTMHIKGFDWTSYVLELANRPSYCNITVKNKESQSMQISMSASNWNLVFFFLFLTNTIKKK